VTFVTGQGIATGGGARQPSFVLPVTISLFEVWHHFADIAGEPPPMSQWPLMRIAAVDWATVGPHHGHEPDSFGRD